MSDQKPEGAEQWIIKQIEQHGLTKIALVILPVCAVIAAFIWWLGRKHALRGAALDNLKKQHELLATLDVTRKKCNSAKETFSLSLKSLREAIDAHKDKTLNESELRNRRDETCRLYEHEYITALTVYVEQISALGRGGYDRVKNEIFPALKLMNRFLEMINKPLLDLIPGAKFQLRKESRDGLFDSIRKCIPIWRRSSRKELSQLKQRTDVYIRQE